jgi:hypothetical protein
LGRALVKSFYSSNLENIVVYNATEHLSDFGGRVAAIFRQQQRKK